MAVVSPVNGKPGVAVEVAIDAPPRSVGVRAYTKILEQVLASLEEIDKLALPSGTARIDWAVDDLSVNGQIRAVIAPRSLPARRDIATLAVPADHFIAGVGSLRALAEIPALFSPRIVDRVVSIGKPVGEFGLEQIAIRQLGAEEVGVVDRDTVEHARRAVKVSKKSFGSLMGRLDILSARSQSGPRAQVLLEGTKRAVTVRAAPDQADLLREAWSKRVRVEGELQRNSVGQPIRIDMIDLTILAEREPISAREILGLAPDWTGDLSTEEYIRQARRG